MTHGEKAKNLFVAGANCAQAVFAAFSDVTGIEENLACRLSCAFGGGLARQRELCGVVSGMTMVLGVLYGYDDVTDQHKKAEVYALEQELCWQFRARYGALTCGALLKPHLKTVGTTPVPDARTPEYYQKRPCLMLVEGAAELLDAFLAEHSLEGNVRPGAPSADESLA